MTKGQNAKTQKNPLLQFLKDDEILTSSEMIHRLVEGGHNEVNARQILRRKAMAAEIWRSANLRLPKDERLFARASFAKTFDFYRSVGEKLSKTNRSGLARCLEALGRRVVLHKIDVMRLLAVAPNPGTVTATMPRRVYERELGGLEEIGIQVLHKDTALESIALPRNIASANLDELANQAAAAIRREALLVRILAEHLQRQNLLAWNRVEMSHPEIPFTTFNGQVFSAFGFSYLSPLVRWKKERGQPTPCPVLIDVYEGRCLPAQVASFLKRIERASVRGRSRMPVLGIVAARDFQSEAWSEAKSKGLLTLSFRQMFGDVALDAMIDIEELLGSLSRESGATDADSHLVKFSDLLKELKNNPVVVCLRSLGFEVLSGLVLSVLGYEGVKLGKVVPWQDTTRDIDAFGFQGNELRVVECKAYHRRKSLSREEVAKFFSENVPALKKWLRDRDHNFNACKAEIWTSGQQGREADAALADLKKKTMPKADQWSILHGERLDDVLPHSIKNRCIQLLRAIAMEETE